jgi:hypothetical protein
MCNFLYDALQGIGLAFLILICGGLYIWLKFLWDETK